jgi:hypothetical protein
MNDSHETTNWISIIYWGQLHILHQPVRSVTVTATVLHHINESLREGPNGLFGHRTGWDLELMRLQSLEGHAGIASDPKCVTPTFVHIFSGSLSTATILLEARECDSLNSVSCSQIGEPASVEATKYILFDRSNAEQELEGRYNIKSNQWTTMFKNRTQAR